MMTLAPNVYWLIPARLIVGFASGLASVVVSTDLIFLFVQIIFIFCLVYFFSILFYFIFFNLFYLINLYST